MTFRVDIQGQLCAEKRNMRWALKEVSLYTGVGGDITCKAIGLGQIGNYMLHVMRYYPEWGTQYFFKDK